MHLALVCCDSIVPNVGRAQDTRPPLHEAALHGHAVTVRVLLDCGADIDQTIDGGRTALLLAAANKRARAVKALVDAGADANIAESEGGFTPLMAMVRSGLRPLVLCGPLDARNRDNDTALMIALRMRDQQAARALVAGGADVNCVTAPVSFCFCALA